MKILDVQELKKQQFDSFRKRRTSQYIRFLDKSVDFVTYYSINSVESTYALENGSVDSYIGDDSPIKYSRIQNLPVYGISQILDLNDFEDDNGGLSNDSYQGELILLPEILTPKEGDAFILNVYDENRIFIVDEVKQPILKSKPHYLISYHIGIPEYLDKINKQVTEDFIAIFDNIGTQDKVIISSNDYDLKENYISIYKELSDYYKDTFFKKKLSIFEILLSEKTRNSNMNIHYIDKFLQKFMNDERIIVMDELLREPLVLDYNAVFDSNDYIPYKKSLYWAIKNKDISNMEDNKNYIYIDRINSPFTLLHGVNNNWYFTSEYYVDEDTKNSICLDENTIYLNFDEILSRYLNKDTSISKSEPYSRVLSIITNHLHNNQIMPGYFCGIIDAMDELQQYEFIPIILYIIRDQINSLTKLNIIL